MDNLAVKFCDANSTYAEICYNILFLIAGPDSDELNEVGKARVCVKGLSCNMDGKSLRAFVSLFKCQRKIIIQRVLIKELW